MNAPKGIATYISVHKLTPSHTLQPLLRIPIPGPTLQENWKERRVFRPPCRKDRAHTIWSNILQAHTDARSQRFSSASSSDFLDAQIWRWEHNDQSVINLWGKCTNHERSRNRIILPDFGVYEWQLVSLWHGRTNLFSPKTHFSEECSGTPSAP